MVGSRQKYRENGGGGKQHSVIKIERGRLGEIKEARKTNCSQGRGTERKMKDIGEDKSPPVPICRPSQVRMSLTLLTAFSRSDEDALSWPSDPVDICIPLHLNSLSSLFSSHSLCPFRLGLSHRSVSFSPLPPSKRSISSIRSR